MSKKLQTLQTRTHQISEEYPPNYEEVKKFFNIADDKGIVFTYGDTLYNPYKFDLPEHLLIHEKVHTSQQLKPSEWWAQYFTDKDFRLEQELEAYIAQYAFIKKVYKGKVSKEALTRLALDLSSEMYGNIISYSDAETRIRRGARELLEEVV